jgi:hypothetical protein
MTVREEKYVTFMSPGSFFAETTTKVIDAHDPRRAVVMAKDIVERYGARPFGFRFETCLVADPLSDGRGGQLDVEPKTIFTSGTYFLGGRLETYDDVAKRADPKEQILLSNMRNNGWEIMCITENGYRSTQPFTKDDFVVDQKTGTILRRGSDYEGYRLEVRQRLRHEFEQKYGPRA